MAARVKKRKKPPVTRSDSPVSRPVAEHRTGIGVLLKKYPPPLFRLWCLRLSLRS